MALAIDRYVQELRDLNSPLIGTQVYLYYGVSAEEYTTTSEFKNGVGEKNKGVAVLTDPTWRPLDAESVGFDPLSESVGSWSFTLTIYSGDVAIFGLGTILHDAYKGRLLSNERIVGWALTPMRNKEHTINVLRIEITILGKYID